MNVKIGTEAPIFLFWECLFQIFGILSLQCSQAAIWNNKQYGVYYTTWCVQVAILEGAVVTARLQKENPIWRVHFYHVLRAGYSIATTSL